jgi:putative transposase
MVSRIARESVGLSRPPVQFWNCRLRPELPPTANSISTRRRFRGVSGSMVASRRTGSAISTLSGGFAAGTTATPTIDGHEMKNRRPRLWTRRPAGSNVRSVRINHSAINIGRHTTPHAMAIPVPTPGKPTTAAVVPSGPATVTTSKPSTHRSQNGWTSRTPNGTEPFLQPGCALAKHGPADDGHGRGRRPQHREGEHRPKPVRGAKPFATAALAPINAATLATHWSAFHRGPGTCAHYEHLAGRRRVLYRAQSRSRGGASRGRRNHSRSPPKQCPIKVARRAQLQLRLPAPRSWGGRRTGAGRRPTAARPEKRHIARPAHIPRLPVLVTIRAKPDPPSLCSVALFEALSQALSRGNRDDFRITQFSVQTDHLHLIVEAASRTALIRGLQGLGGRTARAVNRHLRSKGKVWNARYHARVLTTPREVRNALVYVLLNFRKHLRVATGIDPRSSGRWFDGWAYSRRTDAAPSPVARSQTWLGSIGWQRAGGRIDRQDGPAPTRRSG